MKAKDFEERKGWGGCGAGGLKWRFCKGSQAWNKKSNHLDFFHSPNLATKASLIKERTQHEGISNSQKDPNNNTGIKQGSLFSRKNTAGLMASFLWKCTKSLHVPDQRIQRPMTKSFVLWRRGPSSVQAPLKKVEKHTHWMPVTFLLLGKIIEMACAVVPFWSSLIQMQQLMIYSWLLWTEGKKHFLIPQSGILEILDQKLCSQVNGQSTSKVRELCMFGKIFAVEVFKVLRIVYAGKKNTTKNWN